MMILHSTLVQNIKFGAKIMLYDNEERNKKILDGIEKYTNQKLSKPMTKLFKVYETVEFKNVYYVECDDITEAIKLVEESNNESTLQSFTVEYNSVIETNHDEFNHAIQSSDCISPWMGEKLIIKKG